MVGFRPDPYPGKPRILFIGIPHSSHTHSWIKLLDEEQFNVRLFSVYNSHLDWDNALKVMPEDWRIPTYIAAPVHFRINLNPEVYYSATNRYQSSLRIRVRNKLLPEHKPYGYELLKTIIDNWQPDIIHTLGIAPASLFYLGLHQRYDLETTSQWVLQTRGGSDLTLARFEPQERIKIQNATREADIILCDNNKNFEYLEELGVSPDHFAKISPVPGTGGVDVDQLHQQRVQSPSKSRIILYPKAYNCSWSLSLPVLEALTLCWENIQPFELHMLAVDAMTKMWYWALPEGLRELCYLHHRIPRTQVLSLMSQARVVLAPSLVDGVPNILYETMACGAIPILSPLDTIVSVVKEKGDILFARNLYPNEIAEALTRAMNDDDFVDRASQKNLKLVRRIAHRPDVRRKVVDFYSNIAKLMGV